MNPNILWNFQICISVPLRISSVNVAKSAVSCEFGHITEKILNGKLHSLCSDNDDDGHDNELFSWTLDIVCPTDFSPMLNFCTPWKLQKAKGFLIFSVGIEMERWIKMG